MAAARLLDDEDVRDLSSWLNSTVAFTENLEFTVIEEDDIDPDDVGSRTVPALPSRLLTAGDIAPGVRIETPYPDQSACVVASGTARIS
jgi:hypothetical protein